MRKAVNNILPLNRKLGHSIVKTFNLDLNQIQEFYILLDEPHRIYKPSEEVCGQIILILKKNLSDVFITLSLTGVVKISGDGSALRGSKKSYLFNHAITLYGNNGIEDTNGQSSLAKGEHRFPFIVKLPKKNIFTNVSFEKGEIRYSLKASISDSTHNHPSIFESIENNSNNNSLNSSPDSSNNNNNNNNNNSNITTYNNKHNHPILTCEKYFSIIKPINVNLLPPPQPKLVSFKIPQHKLLKKTVSSTSTLNSINSHSDNNNNNNNISPNSHDSPENELDDTTMINPSIKISLQVGASGYLRGESILVKVNIQHFKNIKNVNGIIVTLIRICRIDLGSDHALQSYRKDLSQSILPLYIDPQTFTCSASTLLKIPVDSFPTIVGCDLVSFQYYVEAVVNLSSNSKLNNNFNHHHHHNNIKINKPKIDHGLDDEDLSNVLDPLIDSKISQNQIYNVDKLKIMKNVITLTNSIVIGTERKSISTKLNKKSISANSPSSSSANSPISPDQNILVLKSNTTSNSSSPSNFQAPISNNTPITSPITSDQQQQQQQQQLNLPLTPMDSDNPTPSYSVNLPTTLPDLPPPLTNLSEKEELRLREEALLPSQPIIINDNNNNNINDITPISNLNNNNNIEENYANIPPSSSPPSPLSQLLPVNSLHDDNLDSDIDSMNYVPAYEETETN